LPGLNSHAILADLPASVGSRLEDTNLLEGLNDSSLDTGGGVSVVGWSGTPSVLGSVELGEGTDTDRLSEVDVTGDGGCKCQ
jgi:hypothetical protein